MIDRIVSVWFLLTAVSVVYVAWDAFTRNPEMKIMRFGWVLVTLYLGPVAAVFYVLSCREPAPGEHEKFVAPMWKQALGSTIHCAAGDATGIVAAATITALLGLPMRLDLIIEYVAGFAFGLLVFQSLFMKDMLGGNYVTAVRKSFLPEFVSMNMMMAGMFPTMVYFMMVRDMRAMEPAQPLFWATMSLAVGIGVVTAFPVNWWLVAAGLKHGMGTERVFGSGGESTPKPPTTTVHGKHGAMSMGEE